MSTYGHLVILIILLVVIFIVMNKNVTNSPNSLISNTICSASGLALGIAAASGSIPEVLSAAGHVCSGSHTTSTMCMRWTGTAWERSFWS